MVNGWASRHLVLAKGGLTTLAWWLNVAMVLTCVLGLAYPWLAQGNGLPFECPFQWLTSLPCPGCGYVRGMHCLADGALLEAIKYNPGLFFYIALQLGLIGIGLGSLYQKRQILVGNGMSWAIATLVAAIWAFKILYDPAYY